MTRIQHLPTTSHDMTEINIDICAVLDTCEPEKEDENEKINEFDLTIIKDIFNNILRLLTDDSLHTVELILSRTRPEGC